jgi:hypothetical protein
LIPAKANVQLAFDLALDLAEERRGFVCCDFASDSSLDKRRRKTFTLQVAEDQMASASGRRRNEPVIQWVAVLIHAPMRSSRTRRLGRRV